MKLKIIALSFMMTTQSTLATGQKTVITGDHFITVEGVKLHYRTGGSGPYLLLLHGFTLSSDQWTPFFDHFAKSHTVLAMDMPGHGKSDRQPGNFGFEKWARLMLNMLDQMGIENIKAAGHSAGAITLMHMAVQNPAVFRSLILVDGGHRYTEEAREDLRHDAFEKADEALRQYYWNIHFGDTAKIVALFDDINYMADKIPVDRDKAPLNPQTLSQIAVPTLLVWGDRDYYFPIDIAVELYRLLPDARLWVIPGKGHTPIWSFDGDGEAGEMFPKIAADFWRQSAETGLIE